MNVDADLVPELQRRNLLAEMPAGHVSQRHAKKYAGRVHLNKSNLSFQIPDVEVSEADLTGMGGRIEEDGTDALAWYSSFHFQPKGQWGIFVLDRGIYYLAKNVFGPMLQYLSGQTTLFNNPLSRRSTRNPLPVDYSFRLLFFHEYFHFLTDIAATMLEICPKIVPGSLYLDYTSQVYMKSKSTNEPLEEALANAYAFDRVTSHEPLAKSTNQSTASHLWNFMKRQPNGYRVFDTYIRPFFTDGVRDLGMCIAQGKAGMKGCAPFEGLFTTSLGLVRPRDVPVYVVSTGISSKRFVDIPIPM